MFKVVLSVFIMALALSASANENLDNLIQQAAYGDLETITAQVSEANIESYVLALQEFPSRMAGTENADLSRAWLETTLEGIGYEAVLDSFDIGGGDYGCNVYAYLEGQSHPDYYIVVGGHRDSWPGSPGANDNATSMAGFLEMARILKDEGTNVSFIFAFYDAKEVDRRLGSARHAYQLATNEDNVIIMLNMDVIGYSALSSSFRLFHYPDNTYALLAQSLAASLSTIDIMGVPSGVNTYYDADGFQNRGFNTLTARESNLSPHNHSVTDSAIYVDYDYAANITRAMLATAIVIDDDYTVEVPGLFISYPNDIPEFILAENESSVRAKVTGIAGGEVASGTVYFNYSIDDDPTINSILMTDLGDETYEVVLPPFECGESCIYFYISAEESGGTIFYKPDPLEATRISIATETISIFDDDMESDNGWTFSTYTWNRGKPMGGSGDRGAGDPLSGYNSMNCLNYNIYGAYQSDISEEYATSAAIDCGDYSNVYLRYKRWLGVDEPEFDNAQVRVSSDGTTWTTVWENTGKYYGGFWKEDVIDITSVAKNQSSVYIRFVMGPTDSENEYCGWNVDDLEIFSYNCESSWICGDIDGVPGINILDIVFLLNYKYKEGPAPEPMESADVNSVALPDGLINILDVVYLLNSIYKGGPGPVCPI